VPGLGHEAFDGGAVGRRPRRVRLLRQQRPRDEGEGGLAGPAGQGVLPGAQTAGGLGRQGGQGVDVEPVGEQPVAGVLPREDAGAEDGAQAADEDGELGLRARRPVPGRLAPQDVDQLAGGDRPPPRQGEAHQERGHAA
jgi:hypothetical protein